MAQDNKNNNDTVTHPFLEEDVNGRGNQCCSRRGITENNINTCPPGSAPSLPPGASPPTTRTGSSSRSSSSNKQHNTVVKVGIGGGGVAVQKIREEEDELLRKKNDILFHPKGVPVGPSKESEDDSLLVQVKTINGNNENRPSVAEKILAIDKDSLKIGLATTTTTTIAKSSVLTSSNEEGAASVSAGYSRMIKAEQKILNNAMMGAAGATGDTATSTKTPTTTTTTTTRVGAVQVLSPPPSKDKNHPTTKQNDIQNYQRQPRNVTEPYQLDASEDHVDVLRLVEYRAAEARQALMENDHNNDDIATEVLSRVPSQPILDGSRDTQQQPGAYAESLGARAIRRNDMDVHHQNTTAEDLTETGSIVVGGGINPDPDLLGDPNNDITERTAASVVEARPVEEDDLDELPTAVESAKPYDIEAAEERKWELRKRFGGLVILSIIVIGVVIVGSVLGTAAARGGDADNNNNSSAGADSTSSPDASDPTAAEDLQHAIISRVDTILLPNLPQYSLESLKNPLSPQSEAYEWLKNHQQINTMELWRMKQLFALGSFYYSFDGPNWPLKISGDWLDDTRSECDWFSIIFGTFGKEGGYQESKDGGLGTCNAEGRFISLHITGPPKKFITYEIENATMPRQIGFLTSLETIKLTRHTIPNGTLEDLFPLEVSKLDNLTTFDLRNNNLLGSIPNYLWSMTKLTDLTLHGNLLTGSVGIPTEVGLLQDLEEFDIKDNPDLGGGLPSEIGLLTKLKELSIAETSLTGDIPKELWQQLTNLEMLDLSLTNLGGSLPSALGLLSSLKSMNASTSSLGGGTIPSQVGLMTNLTILDLGNNDLSGVIPKELGNCTHLKYLQLSHNPLIDGSLPSELGRLTSVVEIWLEDLALTGTLPIEVASLATNHSLGVLNLNNTTALRGTVPIELCELEQQDTCSYFPVIKSSKKGSGPGPRGDNSNSLDEDDMESCLLTLPCSEQLCGCGCPSCS